MLIDPGTLTDIIGILLIAVITAVQYHKAKRTRQKA